MMKKVDVIADADDDDEVRTSGLQNYATATLSYEEFFLRTQYLYLSPLISNTTYIDNPGWVSTLSQTSMLQNRVYKTYITLIQLFCDWGRRCITGKRSWLLVIFPRPPKNYCKKYLVYCSYLQDTKISSSELGRPDDPS
jgi:hypothetical protein